MNENKEKREFAQQLEQIAETLTQAVKDNEGRAFILIGTDVKDNKDGESENVQGVIAVGGNGGQVILHRKTNRAACCRSYGISDLEEVKPTS